MGEMVAEDFRKAEVFRKYGLDFCCGGKITVQKACEKKGIDYKAVERDLEMLNKNTGSRNENFNEWELDFLCDFIVNNHHKYVNDSLPMLLDRKSTRLNSSHVRISYAVFCLKKKKKLYN